MLVLLHRVVLPVHRRVRVRPVGHRNRRPVIEMCQLLKSESCESDFLENYQIFFFLKTHKLNGMASIKEYLRIRGEMTLLFDGFRSGIRTTKRLTIQPWIKDLGWNYNTSIAVSTFTIKEISAHYQLREISNNNCAPVIDI